MSTAAQSYDHVRVGLVVPSYGYANFLPEMARAILAQAPDFGFLAVLVDDSDPDPEIVPLCQSYAAAHPEVFHYIRPRQNGGLSATRNTGVSYLLDLCPNLDMVMFPDADDRMLPGFLQKSYDAFRTARTTAEAQGEKLGWVFEHPNIFGHNGYMYRLTQHATLWNIVGATQMPSSALSAELYRSGLRYDETMKWGGEDWEFSIRALKQGFVGKYGGDLGFLWRRRPGSMSSAALQAKAREHNRTLIRMRNPEMHKRPYVWDRLAQENTTFAVLQGDGWQPAERPAALAVALSAGQAEAPLRDLAATLNNSLTHVSDPCPQSFYIAAQTPGAAADLAALDLAQVIQWSEYLLAQGYSVTHGIALGTSDQSGPEIVPEGPTDLIEVLQVLPRAHLLSALGNPQFSAEKRLRLIWPRPKGTGRRTTEIGLVSDHDTLPPPGSLEAQLEAAVAGLKATGYRFRKSWRFGTQGWQPQGLDWRKLPGFLIGMPSQVLQDAALLERKVVFLHARYVADFCAQAGALGLERADVMLDADDARTLAGAMARLAALPGLGTVHLWRTIHDHGIDLRDLSLNILGLYGTILHWRSAEQAEHLSALRKIGVENRLVLRHADLRARALNFSSMFKCYDSYMLIDGARDAHAALAARGIPGLRHVLPPQVSDTPEPQHTKQRMLKQNAV